MGDTEQTFHYISLQTAYAKLLDIWLFFGLLLPFVAFVLEVLDELFTKQDISNSVNHRAHRTPSSVKARKQTSFTTLLTSDLT